MPRDVSAETLYRRLKRILINGQRPTPQQKYYFHCKIEGLGSEEATKLRAKIRKDYDAMWDKGQFDPKLEDFLNSGERRLETRIRRSIVKC